MVPHGLPWGSDGKESACNARFSPWWCQSGGTSDNLSAIAGDTRDMGSIPGSGRSPGGENQQATPVF